ncbi:MAG: iron ABC transporter permease [Elusimicrobia bacterium]|nr:iron ABC transporter permease [Elusimicrobiota bacterium]
MSKKTVRLFLYFTIFAAGAAFISLFLGVAANDPYIFWNLRAPRVLLGLLVGACLAVSGAVLQAIMKNPKAEPYITGTSAGAALGAVLASFMGAIVLRPFFAFAGGIAATGVVYMIASFSRRKSPHTLILAGVTLTSLLSSIVLLIMVFSRESAYSILFFLTGSLQNPTLIGIISVSLGLALVGGVSLYYSRELDLISLGDEEAAFLGVDPSRTGRLLLFTVAVAVAGAVSAAGIIGFAGLIVPHIVRIISGAGHRKLIPLSAILGAGMLVLCDSAARLVAAPVELPVGVITAFAGAPFFLYLLVKGK